MKLLISFVVAVLLIALVYTFSYAEDFGWDPQYTFSDWVSAEMVGNAALGGASTWGPYWVANSKFGLADKWSKLIALGVSQTGNYLYNAQYQRHNDPEGASIPEMIGWTSGSVITSLFLAKPKAGEAPKAQIVPLKNGLAMTIRF